MKTTTKFIAGLIMSLLSAIISFAQQPQPVQIRNLSVRTPAGIGEDVAIVGFTIAKFPGAPINTRKRVVIRAVGPTLGQTPFNLTGILDDPRIELYSGSVKIAENAGWDNSQPARDAFLNVGAFQLGVNSKDAVIFADLDPGQYTAVVRSNTNKNGIVLVEIYDVSRDTGIAKFTNVSARIKVTGNQTQAGFVGVNVDGKGSAQLLVRGIGPELSQFAITGGLTDPIMTVFNGSGTGIVTNDNWSDQAVADILSKVGAFSLPSGSKSAATLFTPVSVVNGVTLTTVSGATSYTVKIGQNSPAGAPVPSGIVLAELYDTNP